MPPDTGKIHQIQAVFWLFDIPADFSGNECHGWPCDTQEDFDVSEDLQAEIPQPPPGNRWHHVLPFQQHDW